MSLRKNMFFDTALPNFVIVSGCATLVLASALSFFLLKSRRSRKEIPETPKEEPKARKIVDKEKYPGGEIFLYYGTQTGTAESFAREIEREGPDNGFLVHVIDLEDIQLESLMDEQKKDMDTQTIKSVFLVSTYGEGEPTDNAHELFNQLKVKAGLNDDSINEHEYISSFFEKDQLKEGIQEEKKEIEDNEEKDLSCLVGLEYSVFGLGNREYDHYNYVGKFFDVILEKCGGSRMFALGLGDDDTDLEGDFENWKDNQLWPKLKKLYIKDQDMALHNTSKKNELPDCQYKIQYHNTDSSDNVKPIMDVPIEKVHGSSRHYFTCLDCPISAMYELRTENDPGSTIHVEVDISKEKKNGALEYFTADNFAILPQNNMADVECIAKAFDFNLDSIFSVEAAEDHDSHGIPFPMPISVRECLLKYCDITIAPRRSDLKLLAAYATDPIDQQALLRMASKEGKNEYKEKILNDHIGLVQLLKLCPSIKIPSLERFLSYVPLLHPRYYTISSSSNVHPDTVHMTVSITEAKRKDGSNFQGVCTGYLSKLKVGDTIRVFNRPSSFRLPDDISIPIIMIGPGTGIAPMRALLQERSYQREQMLKEKNGESKFGDNILYFGCKRRDQDYLYEKELLDYKDKGVLNHLYLAFSRETKEKVYVQNLLLKNAEETWKLVNDSNAYIYVCGGVKMGNDIFDTLQTIFTNEGKLSKEDAKDQLHKLSKDARYIQELW